MRYLKVYVPVTLYVDELGKVRPLSLTYDGREYIIDKVIETRRTPPEHVGGLITTCYDCVIGKKVRRLYAECTGRWFLEICAQND